MKRSTLTLPVAALALCMGTLVPETAWARTKGGYISPSEADSNSIRPSGMQGSTSKHSTQYAARGRDCGEDAQARATGARYGGVAGSFIPFAGTIISGVAGFFSIQASDESTTKWKNCVRKDVKNGIAKIDSDMHVAVGKVEDNLRAEIVTIAHTLQTEQQRYEERIVSLELAIASVPMPLTPAHTNMRLCTGCDMQIGDLPAVETEPEPESVPPETPTTDTSEAGPVSPSSGQVPKKEVIPPLPVRKQLPALLPGEQYARFSYTCISGTC